MLFYGARHAKRGQGIDLLPVRIRAHRHGFNFTPFIASLFPASPHTLTPIPLK